MKDFNGLKLFWVVTLLSLSANGMAKNTETSDIRDCLVLGSGKTWQAVNGGKNPNKLYFSVRAKAREKLNVNGKKFKQQQENIQRQMAAADGLFSDVLGLTNPLSRSRYQQASRINVRISEKDKPFGIAYDEVTTNRKQGLSQCAISVSISHRVNPLKNPTPAHELFHLYQNGYFMFKNGWLYEGTARWSESLVRKGVGKGADTPLPQNREELQAVMKKSYAASRLWTRLFRLVDENATLTLPLDLADKRYLNGKKIIKDNQAYGAGFIKTLFEALEKQSFIASKDYALGAYNWKEKQQRSRRNNAYIWRAVQEAVNRSIPTDKQSAELKRFIRITL